MILVSIICYIDYMCYFITRTHFKLLVKYCGCQSSVPLIANIHDHLIYDNNFFVCFSVSWESFTPQSTPFSSQIISFYLCVDMLFFKSDQCLPIVLQGL